MSQYIEAIIGVRMDNRQAVKAVEDFAKQVENSEKRISKSAQKTEQALELHARKSAEILKRNTSIIEKRTESSLRLEAGRVSTKLAEQQAKAQTKVIEGEQRRQTALFSEGEKRKTHIIRTATNERHQIDREARRRNLSQADSDQRKMDAIIKRSLAGDSAMQMRVTGAIQGPRAVSLRQNMLSVGATSSQAFSSQLGAAGLTPQQVAFLVGAGGRRPAAFGGTPPGGRGGGAGGGRGGLLRRLAGMGGGGIAGSIIGGLAGGFGVGLGGYALAGAARGIVDLSQQATAYDRQAVAAEKLSGSQEKLNALLNAYNEASGGAVDKTTALNNVTRLLSTGYAKSAEDVSKFVRSTRGASIALGKPQDYVIQETQLAISNVSVKRLDQIGLGITEVNERIEKLRNTNVSWTREMAFQDAVLSLMDEKYGGLTDTVQGQATGVERLGKAWHDLGLEMGQAAQGPVNAVSGALAGAIERGMEDPMLRQKVSQPGYVPDINASEREKQIYQTMLAGAESEAFIQRFWAAGRDILLKQSLGKDFAVPVGPQFNQPIPAWMTSASGSAAPAPQIPAWRQLSEERQNVIESTYDQITQLEKDYSRARLDTIRQYEEQRTNLVVNFAKQMVREEEDFARQRARSQRDYDRTLADMARDSREREAEWQEDLTERIADLREDHTERITEIDEKYQKDREKAEKDHKDRLMKAAGQLDAIAVLEERKRWKKENEEREEGHREALEKAKENLEEQIQEAREAHEERVEDARKADEKRVEDMERNRAQQLADENEDRAIRKNRAIEDHNDQLAEMDRLHGLTMQKLQDEYEEQKGILEDALAAELTALGFYVEGYLDKIKERDEAINKWFQGVIDRLEDEIKAEEKRKADSEVRFPGKVPGEIGAYADGGPVHRTGPAILHAGEFVLSRDMLASGFNPAMGMSGASSSSRSVTTGDIIIQVAPGSEYLVGSLLEEQLIEILGRV